MLSDSLIRPGHARIANGPQDRLEPHPTGLGVPRSSCRPLRADSGALQAARRASVLFQKLSRQVYARRGAGVAR
eukprot:6816185-Alexandrium_andersonii.AAC.1